MAFVPQSLVDKVVSKGVEFVPVVGSMAKYGRKAMIVTKAADPVRASTRAVGYLVAACSGPIVKYPALCSLWAATATSGIVTGNPTLLAASFEFAEMILEGL